ncbi:MAG TPA: family 20 glycosylhydrolase, partial [Fimbriimonadaceae bacterium]|nr:family 20 glycosylhydrolase [Fimbriimonadaceae bacterium]
MWMYDLAREQAPTLEHLRRFCDLTLESGYNALGLYLEHRFAYPSTPWAHGQGCLQPEVAKQIQREYPELKIVPFVNLLGHFEGMLYTEHGKRFREEVFQGMQACPSNPEFVDLARGIIDDTIAAFDSDIIHIGGDETWQLGKCSRCAPLEGGDGGDWKALLYGRHFGPLSQHVVDKGRRPAVWGDMFLEHPSALESLPKETLIFDWQYFKSPLETSRSFQGRGFEVVCCPTLHTYNSVWLHLPQSEENVRGAAQAAAEIGAYGVCVTTWECGLMGNYETLFPAIEFGGKLLAAVATESFPTEADPSALRFEPNDQLSEADLKEDLDVLSSLPGSLSATIVATALEGQRSLRVQREEDLWQVRTVLTGVPRGHMPLEVAQGVARRLLFLANIDPMQAHGDVQGQIRGTYKGRPYSIALRASGELRRVPEIVLDTGGEPEITLLATYADASPWAQLMGVELQQVGGPFAFSGNRSSLKVRLLLQANPFLAWLHHGKELSGVAGDRALAILDQAIQVAPNSAYRGLSEFVKGAVEFVRYAEEARQAYANALPGVATASLAPCRQILENMEKTAKATQLTIGGSLADIERCRIAKEHVERVIKRIKEYGDGSLGYLPAFEVITHPRFVPHDQAAWWLINRWAAE